MISRMNSEVARSVYQNADQQKNEKVKEQKLSSQGDLSKVDQLKADIENGSYRVDLQALAERIADDLL